ARARAGGAVRAGTSCRLGGTSASCCRARGQGPTRTRARACGGSCRAGRGCQGRFVLVEADLASLKGPADAGKAPERCMPANIERVFAPVSELDHTRGGSLLRP